METEEDLKQKYKDLCSDDFLSEDNLPDLADISHKLGKFYYINKNFNDSEFYLRESLEILRQLSRLNDDYLIHYSSLCNDLAVVLREKNDNFINSCELFLESIEITRKLAEKNPLKYGAELAYSCRNLAINFSENGDLSQAERLYRNAIDIWQNIVIAEDKKTVLEKFNTMFELTEILNAGKKYFETVEIYKIILREIEDYDLEDEDFLHMQLSSYNNMARAYDKMGEFENSLTCYNFCLETFQYLNKEGRKSFDNDIFFVMLNISNLYNSYGNYEAAYEKYTMSFDLMKKLVVINPELNVFYMAILQGNFSIACFQLGKYEESLTHITGALKILFTLYNENRKKYLELIKSHLNQFENILKRFPSDKFYKVISNLITLALLTEAEPCYYLGLCLFNSNMPEAAESVLRKGKDLPHNNIQNKFEELLSKINKKHE